MVASTLDEVIVERAQAKRTLERLIIHNKQFKKSVRSCQEWENAKKEKITHAELMEILASKDYRKANDKVDWSDENLLRVLDRSDLWAQMAALGSTGSSSNDENVPTNGSHATEAVEISSNESE